MVFLRVVSEETDVSTAFATEFVRSTGQEVSSSNLYTRPVPVRTRLQLARDGQQRSTASSLFLLLTRSTNVGVSHSFGSSRARRRTPVCFVESGLV
jgi:hypothetical protein